MDVLAWIASLLFPAASAVDLESPRCAACVAVAYAVAATPEAAPAPGPSPAPKPGGCCDACKGTGVIVHGDGHRTPCPCPASCRCKSKAAACSTGDCQKP